MVEKASQKFEYPKNTYPRPKYCTRANIRAFVQSRPTFAKNICGEFTQLRIRDCEKGRGKKMAWFLYRRFCIHTGGARVPCWSPAAERIACGKAHQAPRIAKKNTACAWRHTAAAPGFPRSRTRIVSRNTSVNASSKGRGNLNWHFRISCSVRVLVQRKATEFIGCKTTRRACQAIWWRTRRVIESLIVRGEAA